MKINMKRKLTFLALLLLMAASPACSPAAAPTLPAEDARATALANAWVAITLTQAALPTATETPVPPTPTFPPPTLTAPPLVLSTLAPVISTDTPAPDSCNLPPPLDPQGATVKIKFVNNTDSELNLSFAMASQNEEKECGTYTLSMGRYDQPEITVLAGCYWAWAWVLSPPSNALSPQALCVTDTTKTTSIWISPEVIGFH